ncbi:MAG: TonB-dependent receptor [Alphaproteobacteria bacterium]|nr:TonB-dependent receptor [Alphaproteobacteria bacterium]
MSAIHVRALRNSAACLALLAASGTLWAAPAVAQQVAANTAAVVNAESAGGIETVVVTGTAFDPESAPAKASLDTMEPQTIINRSYIEDSVAETGTYTSVLAIAPSMTGTDLNGPGLSDNGVKNTLRGLPDGSFGLSYDGIPFGDTNGPTHHSESYFPASTIGAIAVDRGPGNAGTIGPSTYGGTVSLFSEMLTSNSSARLQATAGSWGTSLFNGNYQTGDFNLAGFNSRLMINYQDTNTSGYLTYNSSMAQNYTVKFQTELAPGWTATLFGSWNGLFQQLEDNAGATAAQLTTFGKNYALQIDNPRAGTYAPYNHVHKKTDLDYLRLQGDLGNGFTIDNTAYTYAYINKTLSTLSVQQTAADIAKGITENNGTLVTLNSPFATVFPNNVPGYTKQNAYRVWGNVFRGAKDFDFGWLTGQLRAGVWWESSVSQRARSDFDATQCFALTTAQCNPFKGPQFPDARNIAGKTAAPFGGGFFEYQEHSGWNQYEPFVELELHPFENLTITPGFKYVSWDHYVRAPLEQKRVPVGPAFTSFTTTRDLPFVMANYKLQPSWSVYAQYAQGIYVPDISAFEQKTVATTFPKAQTTTNYQFGTVYYADQFTFDADIYYIGVNNNIVYQACNLAPIFGSSGETCGVNTGVATYKGIEAEGTYAFDGVLEGLSVFLNGSLNSSKTGGKWVKQAPMWTSAQGIFYKSGIWKFSLIDKVIGQQYSDATNTTFYKLGAFSNMDAKASVSYQNLEFGVGLYNLLNSRSLAAVGINDKAPIGGSRVEDIGNRSSSLDQYYYQPSRSIQFTIKARF